MLGSVRLDQVGAARQGRARESIRISASYSSARRSSDQDVVVGTDEDFLPDFGQCLVYL